MQKQEPMFTWDDESGTATCILHDGENVFVGLAQCHEKDQDMKSEKTGCHIAYTRAVIKFYTHIRDNEIKPGLAALNQAYYSMNHSKKFNAKSYENRMLRRQIHIKENELDMINQKLTDLKQNLKKTLDDKDKFYKHIRANRGQKE